MLLSNPRRRVKMMAPRIAKGTDNSTVIGVAQLSYWAARNRKTMISAKEKINGATFPASFCC